MKKILLSIATFLVLSFSNIAVASQFEQLNVAAAGYDVVSYMKDGKAMMGSNKNAMYYKGVSYYFSSPENMEMFKASPEKYMPAFGGYCALAMSMGKKVPVDPTAFAVVDGVTYLQSNSMALDKWNKDQAAYIAKANEQWMKVKDVEPMNQ